MPGAVLIQCEALRWPVPGRKAKIDIANIAFPAQGAKMEIIVGEFSVDLEVKGFRHKQGPTPPAGLQLDGADLLFGGDLEEFFEADFMPQLGGAFRAGVYTGAATDALIMGVFENS